MIRRFIATIRNTCNYCSGTGCAYCIGTCIHCGSTSRCGCTTPN